MAGVFLCMGRFLGLTGLAAGGFLGLTAFQAEGCGSALRAQIIKKGGAANAAGCVERLHRFAQGATALRAEGDGGALWAHILKKGARLAPESLTVRMQKKRSPSFRGASFSSQQRLEYIVQGYGCYVIVVGIGAFSLYVEVVFAVESYVLSEGYIAFCTPEFNFFN